MKITIRRAEGNCQRDDFGEYIFENLNDAENHLTRMGRTAPKFEDQEGYHKVDIKFEMKFRFDLQNGGMESSGKTLKLLLNEIMKGLK